MKKVSFKSTKTAVKRLFSLMLIAAMFLSMTSPCFVTAEEYTEDPVLVSKESAETENGTEVLVGEDAGDTTVVSTDDPTAEPSEEDGAVDVSESGPQDEPSGDDAVPADPVEDPVPVYDGTDDEADLSPVDPADSTDETDTTDNAVVDVPALSEAKPAQSFKTECGDVTVEVNAPEGAFPVGTTMEVKPVNDPEVIDVINNAVKGESHVVKAIDISFHCDGKEIEPDVPIQVSLKSAAIAQTENPVIIHVDDAGEAKIIDQADMESTEDKVVFESDEFSVYAVIGGPDSYARVGVEFYNDTNKIGDTMYIKNLDELLGDNERQPNKSYLEDIIVDPGVGTLANGEVFRGWTTSLDYTVNDVDNAMTIQDVRKYLADNVIGTIVENDSTEPVKFYAMIFKYFKVTYYGQDQGVSLGTDTVLYLRDADPEQSAYTINMPFTAETNAKFMGWKATEDSYTNIVGAATAETVYPNNTSITIKGDVTFNVEAPTGHWLVYNENAKGATYNAPDFYLDDVPTSQPATATVDNMHRNGYTFDAWYVVKEGQTLTDDDKDDKGNYIINDNDKFELFTWNVPLTVDVTNVYANWIPNTTAPYTIVFWTENIGSIDAAQADKEYDLTASYTGSGTVGQNIPYNFRNNEDEDYVTVAGTDYHYTGFCLIPASQNTQVKITAEGDAVLNLYFNRIKYDLRFYLYRREGNGANDYQFANNSAGGNNVWGVVNWHNKTSLGNMPTTTYPGGIQSQAGVGGNNITGYYIVLSAFYGEDISSDWPTYGQIGSGTDNQGTYAPVSYVMMVGTKLKPNPSSGGDGTIKGVYNKMDENILGATNDADGNFLIVRFNTYNDWTYHLYYEAYEGQDLTGKTTRVVQGKTYYLDHDFTTRSSNTLPGSQNPPQFAGFAAVMQSASRPYYDQVYIDGVLNGSPQQNGVSGHDAELNYYYTRKEYPIHYMDGVYLGGSDNTNIIATHANQELYVSGNIPYDADISENADSFYDAKNAYEPVASEANEPGFVFEGWYADAACKVPAVFTTMPDSPVTVYAKWIQIQYRVFLHPNAETSASNPDLYWGSDDQDMNFRISYGGKVSTPTGTWTDGKKVFVAWFTDPEFKESIFDGDVFVLNESTVTDAYDKTDPANYTDDMDQWGNGATYNKDVDRWWITKKLDLYAKWRDVTIGADGINVKYVGSGLDATDPTKTITGTVNDAETYDDPLMYVDGTGASATQAAVPGDSDYKFLYWVVQKWDGSKFVDATNEQGELITVFPGDGFIVLASYAQIVNITPDDPSTPDIIETKNTYTVQLRAEYTPNELAKPTYINWYKNDSPADPIHNDPDLQINEAVKIYTIEEGIPTRDGFKFLGWARESEYSSFDAEGNPVGDPIKYYASTKDDLYLRYVEAEGSSSAHYEAKDSTGNWVTVTHVAADEATPYHAMYAVWERATYNLTIVKVVTGNMGDIAKEFTFSLSYNDPNGLWSAEGDANFPTSFKLTDGDEKFIENIPYGVEVVIDELDNTGYNVSATLTSGNKTTVNGSDPATVTVMDDATVKITNSKSIPVDTGVHMTDAPFKVLLALTTICVTVLFFRKRKAWSDEV